MERVSILEFRRDAEAIIRRVQQGKRYVLTYRGKPVLRLEPYREYQVQANDPFYSIPELSVKGGASLTNEAIDDTLYPK